MTTIEGYLIPATYNHRLTIQYTYIIFYIIVPNDPHRGLHNTCSIQPYRLSSSEQTAQTRTEDVSLPSFTCSHNIVKA